MSIRGEIFSSYGIVCGMDAPSVFDCGVTPIPGSGSSPIQIVSVLPRTVSDLFVSDGVGQYVGVYVGDPGLETWLCTISGGGYQQIPAGIAAGTRISLRNMVSGSITTGSISIMFGRTR